MNVTIIISTTLERFLLLMTSNQYIFVVGVFAASLRVIKKLIIADVFLSRVYLLYVDVFHCLKWTIPEFFY